MSPTPYQKHSELGHSMTRYSPNGIDVIEECDCGRRFLHNPSIGYPIEMRPCEHWGLDKPPIGRHNLALRKVGDGRWARNGDASIRADADTASTEELEAASDMLDRLLRRKPERY